MKIFFSGIGGSGVSALAGFAAVQGHSVAGSDRLFDKDPAHPLVGTLTGSGIRLSPQNGEGIDPSCDLAVFSTAIEESNPDLLKARASGVMIRTRPEYLAELVGQYRTIAVAGTSGKSTTSGMLAFLMQRLGMSPGFIGGGRVKQFRTATNPGNYSAGNSGLLVIEACESDGSIVNYRPEHSIIANLQLDHHSVAETSRMFELLAGHTSGLVITGGDDRNLAACSISSPVRYSINTVSAYRATDILYHRFGSQFTVSGQSFRLSLPGEHNLYNALACITLLAEMGIPLRRTAELLPEFSGIERRFDIHLNTGSRLVVDDYAHNPHKIASLMQTMQGISDSICYIFQPHGFGPTRMMKDGYIDVFSTYLREADRLLLLPIYYAGGTAAQDISSADIAGPLRAAGRSAAALQSRAGIFERHLEEHAVVVLGARDDSLSVLAKEIARSLKGIS
ncbi:MAG: Mur ligase family protein [Thermodesulfovibrionales bacterium]